MATTSYGTPMVSSTMPNPTGTSTAPSTITITSPMVSPVMPVTPRVSSRAPLPMTQTPTMTSTPTVSTVMTNPVVPTQTISTPMTTTGTSGPLVNRNMGLPLSSARPIEVTETTPNLEGIQNFPVIGRAADGTHFHQDPVSGQVYRMTEEFHQRIPEILSQRDMMGLNLDNSTQNINQNNLEDQNKTSVSAGDYLTEDISSIIDKISFQENDFSLNFDYFQENTTLDNYFERSSIDDVYVFDGSEYYNEEVTHFVNIINNRNVENYTFPTSDFNRKTLINVYYNKSSFDMNTDYMKRYIPINIFYNRIDSNSSRTFGVNYGTPTRIIMSNVMQLQEYSTSQMIINDTRINTTTNQSSDSTGRPTSSGVHVFTRFNGQRHIIIKDFGDIAPDGMYVLEDCMDDGAGNCIVEFSYGYGPGVTRVKYRYPAPCQCEF